MAASVSDLEQAKGLLNTVYKKGLTHHEGEEVEIRATRLDAMITVILQQQLGLTWKKLRGNMV